MNATLGELVEFVIANRKGKAFIDYSEPEIANLILQSSEEGGLFYLTNNDNKVCGIVLATIDSNLHTFFVNDILTTDKDAFKRFIVAFKDKFSNFNIRGERRRGKEGTPRLINYNTQRLVNLILKKA